MQSVLWSTSATFADDAKRNMISKMNQYQPRDKFNVDVAFP